MVKHIELRIHNAIEHNGIHGFHDGIRCIDTLRFWNNNTLVVVGSIVDEEVYFNLFLVYLFVSSFVLGIILR